MTHFSTRLTLAFLFVAGGIAAQNPIGKPKLTPHQKISDPARMQINRPQAPAVPKAANPFGVPSQRFVPLAPLQVSNTPAAVRIQRDDNGRPIFYTGKTTASAINPDQTIAAQALGYLASVRPEGIEQPADEFEVVAAQTDEQGNRHVRLAQVWKGVTVYGAELIAHTHKEAFDMLNGRFYPSPKISTTPAQSAAAAIATVKNDIGADHVKTQWSEMDYKIIGTTEPFQAILVVYHVKNERNTPHLTWQVVAHPNLMRRVIYFIDAQTGAILHQFDHTCNVVGPVTGTGTDLLGTSRSFGAWQVGSNNIVLEDAGQSMFNSTQSQMPDEPVGAIVTLDGLSTSPEQQSSFNYDFVKSTSTSFNNPTAVSAHWNSIKSYEYYFNKFARKSIDGVGGNIIAFVNITESDGSSMENAFWNGNAMWYGNGGSTFKKLARGLDVGGHEMTHGVVEKTANLEYQDESGALNESFADVFGAMIDSDDWKIGEDVMQAGASPNGCLRDLSNPHNGDAQGGQWWQPAHYTERYTGNQDNGGVHINSGITNKAFYLFATDAAVGSAKAEQVYYKALRDYLVKSSQFLDCRNAVIQAATDLYGSSVANAAANAFQQVGIGGSGGGGGGGNTNAYLGQLTVNPGTDLVLCTADDYSSLDLATGSGNVLGTIYNEQEILSRPSISDDGKQAVFVNKAGDIIYVTFEYAGGNITPTLQIISQNPEWRNAAISKDGERVAALSDANDNIVYLFDLFTADGAEFTLYNPTYTQGETTSDVAYADVMDFDYSGDYIMYDSYNNLQNNQGQDLSYWDIGFIQIRENGSYVNNADVYISKLFSGLPEKTNVGNPTFSKNSPYIIAFDLYDESNNRNDIIAANSETGDYNVLVQDVGDYSWPNYDREDKNIIFHSASSASAQRIYKQGVNSTKIQPQGGVTNFIDNHVWGVWFANGSRSLMVDTKSPALQQMDIAPNPTTSMVWIAGFSADVARFEVFDLLGRRLAVVPAAGTARVGIDVSAYTNGVYHLVAYTTQGALLGSAKIIKD